MWWVKFDPIATQGTFSHSHTRDGKAPPRDRKDPPRNGHARLGTPRITPGGSENGSKRESARARERVRERE